MDVLEVAGLAVGFAGLALLDPLNEEQVEPGLAGDEVDAGPLAQKG